MALAKQQVTNDKKKTETTQKVTVGGRTVNVPATNTPTVSKPQNTATVGGRVINTPSVQPSTQRSAGKAPTINKTYTTADRKAVSDSGKHQAISAPGVFGNIATAGQNNVDYYNNMKQQRFETKRQSDKNEAQTLLQDRKSAVDNKIKENPDYALNLYQFRGANGEVLSGQDYKNRTAEYENGVLNLNNSYLALQDQYKRDGDANRFNQGVDELTKKYSELENERNALNSLTVEYNSTAQSEYDANKERMKAIIQETSALKKNGGDMAVLNALNNEYVQLQNRNEELKGIVDDITAVQDNDKYQYLLNSNNQKELTEFESYLASQNDGVVGWATRGLAKWSATGISGLLSLGDITADLLGEEAGNAIYSVAESLKESGTISDESFEKISAVANELKEFDYLNDNTYSNQLREFSDRMDREMYSNPNMSVTTEMMAKMIDSSLENMVRYNMLGEVGTYAMALSTLGDSYYEMRANGYSKGVSIGGSLLKAYITKKSEELSTERYFKILGSTAGSKIDKAFFSILFNNAISSVPEEGLEEGAEYIGDYLVDVIANALEPGKATPEFKAGDLFNNALMAMGSAFFTSAVGSVQGTIAYMNAVPQINSVSEYHQFSAELERLKAIASTEVDLEVKNDLEQFIRSAEFRKAQFEEKSATANAVTLEEDFAHLESQEQADETYKESMVPDATNMANEQAKIDNEVSEASQAIKDITENYLASRNILMNADEYVSLSEESRRNVSEVQNYATKLKVKVGFSNSVDGDGFYDPKTNTIMLNPNSKMGELSTLVHEITHGTESSGKFYDTLANLVKDSFDGNYDNALKNIKSFYKKQGIALDDSGAKREFTAINTQHMLGNKEFVEKLVRYDNSLAYRIYRNVLSMTSSDVKTEIENAFMQAFKNVQTNGEMSLTLQQSLGMASEMLQINQNYEEAVNKGDLETAQKLVDKVAKENGYDIKAYHGTNAKFTQFSNQRSGKNFNNYLRYGTGFYFAPTAEETKRYGKNTMSVYLSADRLLDASKPVENEKAYQYLIDNGYHPGDAKFAMNYGDRFVDTLYDILLKDYSQGGANAQVQSLLREFGYDGVVAFYGANNDKGEVVVFDPSQIKSADPVTYDENGKIIPLDERFNRESDDIRYSKGMTPEQLKISRDYNKAINDDDMEVAQELVRDYAQEYANKTGQQMFEGYHGTNARFNEFLKEKLGSKNIFAESAYMGFFMAGSEQTAENYTGLNDGDLFKLMYNSDAENIRNRIREKYNYGELEAQDNARRKQFIDDAWARELASDSNYANIYKRITDQNLIKELDLGDYTDTMLETIRRQWNSDRIDGDSRINKLYDEYDNSEEHKRFVELQEKASKELNEEYVKLLGYEPNIKHLFAFMKNPLVHDFKNEGRDVDFSALMKQAKKNGNDGVVFQNVQDGGDFDTIYAVFEPNQFKSADPVTYGDDGNVIPLEERFNQNTNDLRYSKGMTTEQMKADSEDAGYSFNGKTVGWKDERIDALIEQNEKGNLAYSGSSAYQYFYAVKMSPQDYIDLSYTDDPLVYDRKTYDIENFPEEYENGRINPDVLAGDFRRYDDTSDPKRTRYKRLIEYMNFMGEVTPTEFGDGVALQEQEGNHRAIMLNKEGYTSIPVILGTTRPLSSDRIVLNGLNTRYHRNSNYKAFDKNDVIELTEANRDALIEKFGSDANADVQYSKGMKPQDLLAETEEYRATIAPYYDTRLNENNRDELIKMAEEAYDNVAKEIADYLGIKLTPKAENIGGFENDEGKRLRELSWTYDLKGVDSETARLFTSLMGDLAFENQEAVICMRYLSEDEGQHIAGEEGPDGGTYGKEYGFKYKDLKTVEEALKKADIANYNIDRKTNYLTVQDFGFDDDLPEKLDILLEGNNYETKEERPIYSYYLSREARQSLYEARGITEGGLQEGNQGGLSGRISEANKRVTDVIEKKKSGTESPFLRRPEVKAYQQDSDGDLNLTDEDLKNYRVIDSATTEKYGKKNIDKETGIFKPKAIIELDSTIGKTTHEEEIQDGEEYAGKFVEALDNGADVDDLLQRLMDHPLENGLVRAYYVSQALADRGMESEYMELAQWARDIDNLGGKLIESTKILYNLDSTFSKAVYLTQVEENLKSEYKERLKNKKGVDVEQAISEIFNEYANKIINSKTSREFRSAIGALTREVNRRMPKTIWDRIHQYRMLAMLSGTKTAVSNFVSNTFSLGLYKMNSMNQALLESAMQNVEIKSFDDKKTYQINQEDRNATLRKDSTATKRNRKLATEIWDSLGENEKTKYGIETEKIPDIIKNNLKIKNETTQSKLSKAVGGLFDTVQNVQGVLLNDAPFAKVAFVQKFDELARARGINTEKINKSSKEYARLIDDAYNYAQEVVSHNDTDISKTIANLTRKSASNVRINEDSTLVGLDKQIKRFKERANNGEPIYRFIDSAVSKLQKWFIPFYKTNASLLQKSLQYSPLEWGQVINDWGKVKAGRMEVVDMVEHMSKAVTGTELYLVGAIFGFLGLLKWEKDDEDYSGRLSIKIPGTDKGYTVDFIDPISTIFAKGVVLAQNISEQGGPFKTIEGLVRDYEDIFLSDELDMFSSMKDFFDTVGKVRKGKDDYGEYTLGDGATDIAFSVLNSYIPSIVRDVSRMIDPAKKNVYDTDNKKYLFNRLVNSTPFRTSLVDKKDATGRTINYTQPFTGNDVFDRLLTQMVSRGKLVDSNGQAITTRSGSQNMQATSSDSYMQMAKDFQYKDENGDGFSDAHWIRDSVPSNIYPAGVQTELTPKEKETYGKTWTDTWTSGANYLADNDIYKGLSYENQADVVYELQGFARECIEADYCMANDLEMTEAQRTANEIRKFCTVDGKLDGKMLGLIALGAAKENKLASGGQRYVMAEQDEEGKTIRNSRQLAMRHIYEEAGIYDKIVEAVQNSDGALTYADFGLGKTVVEKYSDEKAGSDYQTIYNKTMKSSSKKSSKVSGGSAGGITKAKGGGSTKKLSMAPNPARETKVANSYLKAYADVFKRNSSKATSSSGGTVICPKCGNRVYAGAKRCPVCGTSL